MRFDQVIRNLARCDLEISLVVIRLGVTRLKKTRFVNLLDLFGGTEGKGGCDLVWGASLDDWVNGGFVDVFFLHGMVLDLWEVNVSLGDEYGMKGKNRVTLLPVSKMSVGFHSRY